MLILGFVFCFQLLDMKGWINTFYLISLNIGLPDVALANITKAFFLLQMKIQRRLCSASDSYHPFS